MCVTAQVVVEAFYPGDEVVAPQFQQLSGVGDLLCRMYVDLSTQEDPVHGCERVYRVAPVGVRCYEVRRCADVQGLDQMFREDDEAAVRDGFAANQVQRYLNAS